RKEGADEGEGPEDASCRSAAERRAPQRRRAESRCLHGSRHPITPVLGGRAWASTKRSGEPFRGQFPLPATPSSLVPRPSSLVPRPSSLVPRPSIFVLV